MPGACERPQEVKVLAADPDRAQDPRGDEGTDPLQPLTSKVPHFSYSSHDRIHDLDHRVKRGSASTASVVLSSSDPRIFRVFQPVRNLGFGLDLTLYYKNRQLSLVEVS